MDIAKIISALNSDLRREILKTLAERPYTVLEVLNKLKKKGLDVKYRETVYRALEKLVDAELVEKFYTKEKGLCYKLPLTRITIEITKESLDIEK
jgi:Fe2+ or Zn2+ uptake regulation protein